MTGAYEETLTDMRGHVAGAEPGAARTADNLRQEEAKEPAREPSEGAHPNDSDLGSLVHAHMWPSHTQERPAAVDGAWLPAPLCHPYPCPAEPQLSPLTAAQGHLSSLEGHVHSCRVQT